MILLKGQCIDIFGSGNNQFSLSSLKIQNKPKKKSGSGRIPIAKQIFCTHNLFFIFSTCIIVENHIFFAKNCLKFSFSSIFERLLFILVYTIRHCPFTTTIVYSIVLFMYCRCKVRYRHAHLKKIIDKKLKILKTFQIDNCKNQ